MNTNKKSSLTNNGWILCPSKTFLGKMYYFNVQTGEAVWSLGENEKFNLKKDSRNVQKANSYHNYPEPPTPPNYSPTVPPANICPSTSNMFPNHNQTLYQRNWNNYAIQNQPIFGQPPRFVPQLAPFMPGLPNVGMPNLGMPNVVWTPIQLPTPRWPYSPEDKKPTVDRITQTSTPDRELFVQTSGISLCHRFVNYEKPLLTFNEENKIIKKSNNFMTSTPIKVSDSKMEYHQNQVPISKFIPEPVSNMETESHSSVIEQSTLDSSIKTDICKTVQSEVPHKYNLEKTVLCSSHKIQNLKAEIQKSPKKNINDLHSSDLRFFLLAKRMKTEEEIEEPANKKPKLQVPQTPPKKKVTFNLENLHDCTSEESGECTPSDQTPECKTSFYKITMSPTQTMLNYYNMLENKNPVKNNMPTRNTPTSVLQKRTCTNDVQNCPSRSNFISKNNFAINNNIKKCVVNDTWTGNMPNENTFNNQKYVQREDCKNHPETPILKEAPAYMPLCNNPTKSHTLVHSEYVQKNREENITINEATKSMPICNTPVQESANFETASKDMSTSTLTRGANSDVLLKEVTKSMPNSNTSKVTNSYTIKDVWYLVVDIDVLLEDLTMIDQLLESDEKCKLLIPQRIYKDIEALCIGDCRGQQRVLVARQISRRISSTQEQIVITPNEEDAELTATDAILNTCTRFIDNQYYVVLITNDAELQTKARTLNIKYYKPQEIKNGALIRPKLFSELKKIKVIVDNDDKIDKDSVASKNISKLFTNEDKSIPVDMFKKQLFCNDKQTDKNCDLLINITKPKIDINSKFDDYLTKIIKISNHDERSILRDSHIAQDFENQSQNDEVNKIDINSQENQNGDPKTFLKNQSQNLENLDPNSDFSYIDNQNSLTSNDNFQNTMNNTIPINSTPIIINTKENNTQNEPISNDTNNTNLQKNEKEKITEKIICTLNTKGLNINTQSLGNFKIPKLLPLKRQINTSAPKQGLNATENIHSNFKNSADLEGRLKRFFVKSKMMHEKITTRMDEWTCAYTQIMEDLLNNILQANPKYKEIKLKATKLRDSLTCLKKLYSNEELKNIVELLVDMLDKCSCSKGKIKLDTTPKDFMKMIGCGVLLVQALKTVIPSSDILMDYETYLEGLITNIESKVIELDPEPLRSSLDYHSDIEDTAKEARLNFLKDPSYIIEYLKKHYKEWASYDENQEKEGHQQKNVHNDDFTVVRMTGKNLNRVKIDNNKCISYARSSIEKEYTKQDEQKIVKISLNDSQPTKDNKTQVKETTSILKKVIQNQHDEVIKENAFTKIVRLIENVSQNIEDNENAVPQVITETKIKREPLDLEVLDYEISIITSALSDKIENTDSITENENKPNENFQKDDSYNTYSSFFVSKMDTFQEIFENNKNYASRKNNYANYENTESIIQNENISNENFQKDDSFNTNSSFYISKMNSVEKNENYASRENNYANENYNYGSEVLQFEGNTTNNEDYAVNNDKYANNQMTSRDDSTNDSGIENDCTQAQSVIKIFLIDLSHTFKMIHAFITNFIKEIRGEAICEERMNHLHRKSTRSLQDMVGVTKQLSSIVKRERGNTKLKRLLRKGGTDVISDARLSKYREMIQKCLEQAEILKNALKSIVSITMGDIDAMSTNADSISSGVKYTNIFK